MITEKNVEDALRQVARDVNNTEISKKSLVKFTDSKEDKRFFSYFNGTAEYYHRALPLLINSIGAKNIVELGSREGVSTLCIWDKLKDDAKFTTIDIIKDQRYCPDAMFTDKRVRFVFGDVCDLSIFEGAIPFDIDFLFSDTIHYNFQVEDEFEVYQHLLADTALFAIDDIYVNDKIKFFEKVDYPKWDISELYHASGWGIFLFQRKESLTKEERILRAYQASAKIWKRKTTEQEALVEKYRKLSPLHALKRIIKAIKPLYFILTFIYNHYFSFRYKNNVRKIRI